jgi:hypothetical protein
MMKTILAISAIFIALGLVSAVSTRIPNLESHMALAKDGGGPPCSQW